MMGRGINDNANLIAPLCFRYPSKAAIQRKEARKRKDDASVDRARQPCGGKPCWQAKAGKTYDYRDRDGSADGLSKIRYIPGAAGKGRADARGRNNAAKGRTGLPSGIVAQLTGNTTPTMQMITSNGLCLGATMNRVKKSTADTYKAQFK